MFLMPSANRVDSLRHKIEHQIQIEFVRLLSLQYGSDPPQIESEKNISVRARSRKHSKIIIHAYLRIKTVSERNNIGVWILYQLSHDLQLPILESLVL